MVLGRVEASWEREKQHPIASLCLTVIQSKFHYLLSSAIIGQVDEYLSFL